MSSDLFPPPTKERRLAGTAYFERHVVTAGSFTDVPTGTDLWHSGAQDNRMWQWTLHAFIPLDNLYAINRYDEIDRLIEAWRTQFAARPIEDDFPWHDHATALRLDRISRFAIEHGSAKYGDLAATHCALLMREDFYSKHTNHGFDQAISLVLAAVAFPEVDGALEWKRVGLERLRDEVAIAFTEEGVHVENSPGYHADMLSNLDRAAKVCAAAGVTTPLFDPPFLEGAVDFLAWVMRPDRFLAYMGDTQRTRGSLPDIAKQTHSYQHFLYAQTGGTHGEPPRETKRIFEKSGYAFYRSQWDPWDKHLHLAVKSGFLSRYHRQDDDLNILLHARGEDWLIDSGLYNHNQQDPIRIYMRSAQAHNVPIVHGLQARRTQIGVSRLVEIIDPRYPFSVMASTSVYPGVDLNRRITVGSDGTIYVHDKIRTRRSNPIYWLFHVPADKRVRTANGRARIEGAAGSLMIRVAGGKILPVSIHSGPGGDIVSVTSEVVNSYERSQAIMFGPCDDRDVRFVLSFEDSRCGD